MQKPLQITLLVQDLHDAYLWKGMQITRVGQLEFREFSVMGKTHHMI